jgi:ribosomal protein L44E
MADYDVFIPKKRKKTRKYPPSRVRYMKKNPYITFNVPVELKEKIEELCREKGLSKAQLVKNFFMDMTNTFDGIKQAHTTEIETLKKSHIVEIENVKKNTYQQGRSDELEISKEELKRKLRSEIENKTRQEWYTKGYNEARQKFEITFDCNVCGKPAMISKGDKAHLAINTYLREEGWGHGPCIKKA